MKIVFLISQQKNMLWVLKRIHLNKMILLAPKTHVLSEAMIVRNTMRKLLNLTGTTSKVCDIVNSAIYCQKPNIFHMNFALKRCGLK